MDNESIVIPTGGGGVDYTVAWGDGNTDSNLSGDATHEYDTAGIYTVSISGDFNRIYFFSHDDREKIQSIEHWGDIQWSTMRRAFDGCSNLTYAATDAPDLSNVTDMSYMFANSDLFDGDLSNWDVSNVTNMQGMFSYYSSHGNNFNGDLSTWDVSNVTNMREMFSFATSFNSDISNWDVSSVTTMISMFQGVLSFEADIGNWDVSSVTNMTSMFSYAKFFNVDISNWEVSNVTSMNNMFYRTEFFDGDLSKWDIGSVINMDYMFSEAKGLSRKNYDGALMAWSALPSLQDNVNLGASNVKYCESENARSILINNYGWSIYGDSKDCSQTIKFEALGIKTYGDEDFTLNAIANSGLPVYFSIVNQNIASVNGDTVSLISAGTTDVIASQPGNEYYESAESIRRKLVVLDGEITALNDLKSSKMKLYPNPTQDVVYLHTLHSEKSVTVFNDEGKVISTYIVPNGSVEINLKNKPSGVYYIRLDDERDVFKILKN